MQTKILFPLIVLVMSVTASAQQSFYSTTMNKAGLPEKEISFSFSVVPDKTSPSFGLYVINPVQKKIELKISHLVYGEIVDTSITSALFNRRYNFELVEDGRYLITLSCGKEKISKTVEINTVTTRNAVIE